MAAALVVALLWGCSGAPTQPPTAPGPTPQAAAPRPAPPVAAPIMHAAPAAASMAMMPVQRPPDTARYPSFGDNPWRRVAEAPVATFSASVDTGSYANVRRFIARGTLPPRDAVRVEELVNYFGYDDAPPANDHPRPFAVHAETAGSPWAAGRGLLRVAIKGRDIAKATLPPANLVFLVDVSGSMAPADRLPLVRSALHLLVQQLRPQDRVSIVSYANGTRLVLPVTAGDRKDAIRLAIDGLHAGGGTYGEAGIRLAYSQAREHRIDGGINRVLLATDGDLNIGVTDVAQLKSMIESERKTGIGLTTLGVGDSNYNETLMKQLADAGDGSYHYLDSLQEAHKVLVNQMSSTLAVIAQDLKVQVEFNPKHVAEYRLVGYELHGLTREQFNDDRVDAGDIGAGHSVTALFEWVPVGGRPSVDPLRYQPPAPAPGVRPQPARRGKPARPVPPVPPADPRDAELAWVKLRYKPPGRADSELHAFPVRHHAVLQPMAQASADLRFSSAVAAWGQWLRGSTLIGDYSPAEMLALGRDARGADRYGHRAEWLRQVELSAGLKR